MTLKIFIYLANDKSLLEKFTLTKDECYTHIKDCALCAGKGHFCGTAHVYASPFPLYNLTRKS